TSCPPARRPSATFSTSRLARAGVRMFGARRAKRGRGRSRPAAGRESTERFGVALAWRVGHRLTTTTSITLYPPFSEPPMPTISDVCAYLDRFAPPPLPADWDNVGLLLGDGAVEAQRVLTCLTVTPAVVAEAVGERVEIIVTHHPVLFRGAKRLSTDSAEGRLLWPLARAGIAVYSPHTAFDNTTGGINDSLARRLGLTGMFPLRRRHAGRQCKVVVFVPDADLSKVSDAMFAAGAGVIGQYEQCSFRLRGTGTFFGTESTNPTVGAKGRREDVSEWRLGGVVGSGVPGGCGRPGGRGDAGGPFVRGACVRRLPAQVLARADRGGPCRRLVLGDAAPRAGREGPARVVRRRDTDGRRTGPGG